MKYFSSFRPITVALAVLALMVGGVGHAAANDVSFEAVGDWAYTDLDAGEGILSGQARPGGPYVGVFHHKSSGPHVQGTATLVFGGGSLTFDYEAVHDRDAGTWTGDFVVTGGTGIFDGASGGGSLFILDPGEAGGFSLSGTLSR
jgi:hypothetical protein